MIQIAKSKGLRLAATCALLLSASVAIVGQDAHLGDTDQIKGLIKKLCDHSANIENLVDPQLGGQERKNSLDHFSDPSYELTLIPNGEIKIEPEGHAVVPVRVHFKNSTSTLDANVDVKFIQRGGVWHFANFDFLGWPPILVAVLIVGLSVGIS